MELLKYFNMALRALSKPYHTELTLIKQLPWFATDTNVAPLLWFQTKARTKVRVAVIQFPCVGTNLRLFIWIFRYHKQNGKKRICLRTLRRHPSMIMRVYQSAWLVENSECICVVICIIVQCIISVQVRSTINWRGEAMLLGPQSHSG